jgi:4-carboxymuconolactone decarboxylase
MAVLFWPRCIPVTLRETQVFCAQGRLATGLCAPARAFLFDSIAPECGESTAFARSLIPIAGTAITHAPNESRMKAMSEARFPELKPSDLDAAQAKLAAELTRGPRGSVRGPYVPLIYSPDLADRMRHLGDFIRFEGVLPPKLKEIVIFTVARHWSVEFMFAIHRESAAKLGVTEAQTDALARGTRPQGLTAQEQSAYEMTSELLRTGRVGDAAYAAAAAHFDRRGLIELVNFVGYYTTLAMILNTARIPLPDGVPPLPPAG